MRIEVEELYNWISSIENVNEVNIFDILRDDEKRSLAYKYFNQNEKMEELCEELIERQNVEDDNYSSFIKNIVLLYPLTRKLIIKLNEEQLRENGKTLPALLRDERYAVGFYSGILKDFQILLDNTKNNSAIRKLNEQMDRLDEQINEYCELISEIKKNENKETLSKVEKRNKLQRELESLKKDNDLEKIEESISELIDEINDLKEKKEKEKKNLVAEFEKLNLDELNDKEQEAIKILMKFWHDDDSEN